MRNSIFTFVPVDQLKFAIYLQN